MATVQNTINGTLKIAIVVTALESDLVLDHEVLMVFHWVVFSVLNQMLGLFGIVTNIMNIICLVKQGFAEPVNVSFFGLAVSDMGCLITMIWANICLTPPVTEADLSFRPIESSYLISGMPSAAFTRVTGCITVVITLERCLCIAAPLKIKSIITTRRVSVVVGILFVILIPSGAPVYFVSRLEQKFDPVRNKTLLGLVYSQNREEVETISFIINNVFVPFSAFIIVSVCTVILVINLRLKTKWRQNTSKSAQSDSVSNRNRKVGKMVVMISSLFIISFIPISISFMAMSIDAEFSVGGKYWNILMIIGATAFLLESINSSVNVFFYYNMSSKFRLIFRETFCTMFQFRKRNVDAF